MTTILPLTPVRGQPLQGKYAKILYGSDISWMSYFTDKFRARRAVMLHAVNRRWTFERCESEFTNCLNPGSVLWTHGSDDRLLGAGETYKRLRKDYEKCTRKVLDSPTVHSQAEARQQVGVVVAYAKDCEWRGVAGRTDHDVLMFVTKKMMELGSTRMNLSTRDIALGAGVSQYTARISVTRLCKAGWLLRRAPAKAGMAQELELQMPRQGDSHENSHNLSYDPPLLRRGYMRENENPAHETWVRLGKAPKVLYESLQPYPLPANELSAKSGIPLSTAYRNLPRLASYGLAKKLADGWVLGKISPDDVPHNEGWLEENSKAEQRKEKFTEERTAHKLKLDAYARLHPRRTVKMMTPRQQLARLRQDQASKQADHERTAFGELSDIGKLVQAEEVARIKERYPSLATV